MTIHRKIEAAIVVAALLVLLFVAAVAPYGGLSGALSATVNTSECVQEQSDRDV